MANVHSEQDLLISRVSDLYYLALERQKPVFSQFLNENEISICLEAIKNFGFENYSFFGGYKGSQRQILGFSANEEDFPVSLIEFTYRKQDKPDHRQFLGTILSTGLKRSVVGDIICMEGRTYVFVLNNHADFLVNQISRVARVGVKSKVTDISDFQYIPAFVYHNYTVSSLRLDNIVSAVTGLSRDKTRTLILSGSVFKNHIEAKNVSANVDIDDVISIRKYGKFILQEVNGLSKKGRHKIIIKQYK